MAFATAMRRTGLLMQLVSQAAADRIGINSTDLKVFRDNLLRLREEQADSGPPRSG